MAFIEYSQEPELRSPVLVAAFGGWNDAADAATTALKFLVEHWKPLRFAELEGEDFFLFTETRPTIQFTRGMLRKLIWPGGRFFFYSDPALDHDIETDVRVIRYPREEPTQRRNHRLQEQLSWLPSWIELFGVFAGGIIIGVVILALIMGIILAALGFGSFFRSR